MPSFVAFGEFALLAGLSFIVFPLQFFLQLRKRLTEEIWPGPEAGFQLRKEHSASIVHFKGSKPGES
jgi:hypothetical protein